MATPTAPQRLVDIVHALYERYRELAHGTEDQRRQLTRMMGEQAKFDLGNGYGTKRADPGRPPSKDAIALSQPPMLWSWDWQDGATREPRIHTGDPALDITGQVFIDVEATNHLGAQPPTHGQPYPSEGDWWIPVFNVQIEADYREAGLRFPDNSQAFFWHARTSYDIGFHGLTKEASLAKHRAEWRAALGLPAA